MNHYHQPGRLYGRARHRPGFVLLMSLVLIALVGVMLSGLARRSLLIATETHEAKSDLQRRWAAVFLSKALLAEPEPLISRYLGAETTSRPLLPLRESLQLGELTFRVTLDDENRKLNINRLRATGGTREVLGTIHRFAGAEARVALKPLHASSLGVREFDSWGHVLEFSSTDDALRAFEQVEGISRGLTCWGDAKVNVRRSDDEVLCIIGTLAAGPVTANRLLALRNNNPQLNRDELLAKLAVSGRKLALLKGWLSDQSDCYSLWIVTGDRRTSLDFFVRENSGSESHTVRHFQW